MLEAIEQIQSWIARGYTGDDDVFRAAVIRELAVIGEAANHLSVGFKRSHPQVLWSHMTGLRNFAVHQYWDTQWPVLQQTVDEDLDPLKAVLLFVIKPPRSRKAKMPTLATADTRIPLSATRTLSEPSASPRCGRWMPIARTYCARPAGHRGGCKSKP